MILDHTPGDLASHHGLAKIYDAQDRKEDALAEYLILSQIISNPSKLDDSINSVQFFKQVILTKIDDLRNNNSPNDAYTLALILIKQGSILSPSEKVELANPIANQLTNIGETQKSINLLQSISPGDGNANYWVILGKAYNKDGNFEEAIKSFNQAIVMDPQNYWANHMLSSIYSKNENWNLASQHAEIAFSTSSNNTQRRINSGLLLADAYNQTNRKHEACSIIDELKLLQPDNARIEDLSKEITCQN